MAIEFESALRKTPIEPATSSTGSGLIKKTPPGKEVVDLNAAILEVTALTQSEAVKSGVTLGTQLAGDLPRIRCDRVQPQ
jgi:hypothetical protein